MQCDKYDVKWALSVGITTKRKTTINNRQEIKLINTNRIKHLGFTQILRKGLQLLLIHWHLLIYIAIVIKKSVSMNVGVCF